MVDVLAIEWHPQFFPAWRKAEMRRKQSRIEKAFEGAGASVVTHW